MLLLLSVSSTATTVSKVPNNKYVGHVLAACGRIMAVRNVSIPDILDTPDKDTQRMLINNLISNGVPKEAVKDVIRAAKLSLDRYKFAYL